MEEGAPLEETVDETEGWREMGRPTALWEGEMEEGGGRGETDEKEMAVATLGDCGAKDCAEALS